MTDQNASAGLGAPDTSSLLALAHELVNRAKRAGAQEAEAVLSESRAMEAGVREGKLETVEEDNRFELHVTFPLAWPKEGDDDDDN